MMNAIYFSILDTADPLNYKDWDTALFGFKLAFLPIYMYQYTNDTS